MGWVPPPTSVFQHHASLALYFAESSNPCQRDLCSTGLSSEERQTRILNFMPNLAKQAAHDKRFDKFMSEFLKTQDIGDKDYETSSDAARSGYRW